LEVKKMDKEKKFFIRIGNHVEQVTEEIYREYFKMLRRERYLEERDLAHGRFLYSQFDNAYEDILGEEMLVDRLTEEEVQAIVYHDGQYVEDNRSCATHEERLTLLLQYADSWSGFVIEK
jgi:hypothetical protein